MKYLGNTKNIYLDWPYDISKDSLMQCKIKKEDILNKRGSHVQGCERGHDIFEELLNSSIWLGHRT